MPCLGSEDVPPVAVGDGDTRNAISDLTTGGNVTRRLSLLVVLALALSIVAVPVSAWAAPTRTSTFTSQGLGASLFFSTQSGCVQTDVYQDGSTNAGTVSGMGRTTLQTQGFMFIDTYNTCTDEFIDSLFCYANNDLGVEVDRQLSGGSVTGTFSCGNEYDEEDNLIVSCTVTKNETLVGVGPTFRGSYVERYSGPGYRYFNRFSGQFRDANVTSATVSGCGLNLTEADVQFAELVNARSTSSFTMDE